MAIRKILIEGEDDLLRKHSRPVEKFDKRLWTLLDDMAQTIDESMAEMVGSADYPNFTKVEANEDYTVFTVTTKSKSLSLDESLSLLQFYTEGAFYSVVSGNDADSIHVDFVNADTGEVIDGGTQSLKD